MFFDQRFIDFLHANLDEVGAMNWRQFEGLVAERLRRSGLHVKLDPGETTKGVDIRAWESEPRSGNPALLLVKCKRTSAKVDRVVVKALASDVMYEGATRGLVATTFSMVTWGTRHRASSRLPGRRSEPEHDPRLAAFYEDYRCWAMDGGLAKTEFNSVAPYACRNYRLRRPIRS